jgi:hypothetical protein
MGEGSRPHVARRFTATMRQNAFRIALIATFALVLALVPVALAGKGGGGKPGGGGGNGGSGGASTSGSYTATVTPGGPYVFGQQIWVTTNAPVYPNNAGPWIAVDCYQDGMHVSGETHSGFAGAWYYGDPFYLGPSMSWSGGDADCKVRVYHQSSSKTVTDATTSFHVDG